jgi:hypothetical protein
MDANVQRLWNGNHTEFLTDFYRYLENASKNHDDPSRVPSADLWTDGKGSDRRNALHQVLGLAKSDADTFLNAPTAEINRNTLSSVFSFSLNRMTGLRVRKQSVPFTFENAYRDLVRNWSPAEMDSELTPRGTVFKHPSGFKFVQREDGKTDAFDELGKRIGTYQTAKEATEAGRRYAIKHPSTVMLKDNMTDNSVINRSPRQGEGEVPYRGGDDYWKSEGNIFEYKDEQGFTVRRAVVGDKRNPDNVLYMEIGHGWQRGNKPAASESYMWGYNDKNVDNSYVDNNSGWQLKKVNLDGKNKAHEQLAKFQTSSYQGRIELPENGQKGRISILDRGFRDDPEISLKKAKNIKEGLISRIQKQLKKEGSDVVLNPKDFDAYLFYPSKEVKQSFGLGARDKLPVKFSPRQGEGEVSRPTRGRYTSEEFKEGLVGRFASENPSISNGIRIEYRVDDALADQTTAFKNRQKDKYADPVQEIIIYDNSAGGNGEKIGEIVWTGLSRIQVDIANISEKHQEKGYGKLIYSEAIERMRELGAKTVQGWIVDNKGRPKKIRETIIDKVNQELIGNTSRPTELVGDGDTRSYLDERAWYSPREGEGELGTSRFSVPREEPRFNDSIGYYEQFAMIEGRTPFFDPTYFESLVKAGKKGEGQDFSTAPDPKYHNLWQYLDYHQQAKSTVTVGDILNFIKEQGINRAPNIPRDYHSKFAQTLLALSDTAQLNTRIELLQSGSWTGGETGVTMTREYQRRVYREANFKERLEILNELYKKAPTPELEREIQNLKAFLEKETREKEAQKKKIEDELKKPDEDSGDENAVEVKEKHRFPVLVIQEKKGHQQMFMNLDALVNEMWAASKRQNNQGNQSGSPYQRRRNAFLGNSFEGTALEELGHSIFGRISREAAQVAPELASLIETDAPQSVSGVVWKNRVNDLISKTKNQIKNGLVLPPSLVAFARILELQKYALENTYIMNPKGVLETMWDSKGFDINDNVYTDTGKLKSGRGRLKKGYRVFQPFEAKGFKGSREQELPARAYNNTSVYRLGSTQEFMIALLNSPEYIARWNQMPYNPHLLDGLTTPDVEAGFSPNVAKLHNQMSEGLSQFSGYREGFSHMVLEEMIRTIDAGREIGTDIKPQDLQNKRGLKSELPERPKGFLTPYEKAFVNDWRVNMDAWSKANNKPNAIEGLSDFEIWERVGNDKPPFEGSDEAMKDPSLWRVNAKDIVESQSTGVQIGKVKVRDADGNVIGETEGMIREGMKITSGDAKGKIYDPSNAPKKTIGRWDEKTQRWIRDDSDFTPDTDTTTDTTPDIDTTTTRVDDEGKTVVVDEEGKDVTDDDGRTVIVDDDGRTVVIDDEGNKVPPKKIPVPKKTPVPTPTPTKVPPAPMPKRDFTQADIRAWRSWKYETYGNSSALKNALNYVIMQLNGNFRVYNPQKALLGIYKDEEEAKRRVQREEPKR